MDKVTPEEFVMLLGTAGYVLNWLSAALPNSHANGLINFLLGAVNMISANIGTSKNKD